MREAEKAFWIIAIICVLGIIATTIFWRSQDVVVKVQKEVICQDCSEKMVVDLTATVKPKQVSYVRDYLEKKCHIDYICEKCGEKRGWDKPKWQEKGASN